MSEINAMRAQRILERLRTLTADLSGHERKDLVETATFLELGFDSLFLTQLASAFQGEYGLKITFRQLFAELPTLRAMAEHIDRSLPAEPALPQQPVASNTGSHVAAPAAEVPAALPIQAMQESTLVAAALPVPEVRAAVPGGALQAVMNQQLALMAQQLALLQGLRVAASAPTQARAGATSAAVAAATSLASVSSVAPAAASAAAAPVTERVKAAPASQGDKPALPKGFGPQVAREDRSLTPSQRDHLDRLIARYTARTQGSKQHVQAHRPHHADPRTAAGFNRLWKEMVYPIVVQRSSGCRLIDLDGNEYIDILNGFGPNFLGHNPPFIKEALLRQIDLGLEVGPQTPLAGETARLFCELTGMDRVSWVNTGSEAVQAAIRLSRTYTGRNRIVVFSGDYHGNFDEVLVRVTKTAQGRRTLPLAPGIPMRAVEDVLVLDYGTEESLELIRRHAKEIAAVLVEPVQSRRPDFQPREFLHALRQLTEQEGIVLVFDEVITGFRIAPGGAQAYYGVEADLATYGKIVGGGMPIGVVAGRARFMDTFDGGQWRYGDDSFPEAGVTFFAGTFVRHPLAIAAAHAALSYVKEQGPALQDGVNRRTTRYATEMNRFFEERGVGIRIPHFASQMFIRVTEDSELATLVFYHLRDRGIHVLEGFPSYMTAAHTDEDVDRIIAAFKDSVLEMQADGVLPRPAGEALSLPWRRQLPLTSGQHEVWMAAQMGDMASCAFNESDTLAITGALDVPVFTRSVDHVLAQHEAFRLRFDRDGRFQWVDRDARFETVLVDLSAHDGADRSARLSALIDHEALTPFDLERGPLVRTRLVRLQEQSHLFVLYAHHLVFDGHSSERVMQDIARVYAAFQRGEPAPALGSPAYSVYVHRSQRVPGDAAADASLAYWRSLYAELPSPLDLPADRPRTAQRSYRGGTVHRELDAGLSQSLRDCARSLNASLGNLLLAGFAALLGRLANQEDIIVGIPSAGQARLEIDTVGYCVDAMPLRCRPVQGMPFTQFLDATQRSMLDAIDHQATPLGELVASLRIPRDPSRLPLVEVMFNHSRYFAGLEIEGCGVSSHENHRRAINHDLFFNIVEADGRLVIDFDHCSDLFDAATIERWIDHYCELLRGVMRAPSTPVGELPLLSEQQGAAVIAMWGQR